MARLSFSVFKDKILSGAKRQTIRKERKNPIKVGETLYLWWEMRTSQRQYMGKSTCKDKYPVKIFNDKIEIREKNILIVLDQKNDLNYFAIADGFDSWNDLIEFFEKTHGLPFEGVLIKWGELKNQGENNGYL